MFFSFLDSLFFYLFDLFFDQFYLIYLSFNIFIRCVVCDGSLFSCPFILLFLFFLFFFILVFILMSGGRSFLQDSNFFFLWFSCSFYFPWIISRVLICLFFTFLTYTSKSLIRSFLSFLYSLKVSLIVVLTVFTFYLFIFDYSSCIVLLFLMYFE
jgi:hypothetical protein